MEEQQAALQPRLTAQRFKDLLHEPDLVLSVLLRVGVRFKLSKFLPACATPLGNRSQLHMTICEQM